MPNGNTVSKTEDCVFSVDRRQQIVHDHLWCSFLHSLQKGHTVQTAWSKLSSDSELRRCGSSNVWLNYVAPCERESQEAKSSCTYSAFSSTHRESKSFGKWACWDQNFQRVMMKGEKSDKVTGKSFSQLLLSRSSGLFLCWRKGEEV